MQPTMEPTYGTHASTAAINPSSSSNSITPIALTRLAAAEGFISTNSPTNTPPPLPLLPLELAAAVLLLAEEVPDEFLRRAAGGEHLFVAPQYRAHQANAPMTRMYFHCWVRSRLVKSWSLELELRRAGSR